MRSDHFTLVVVVSLGVIAWSLYQNYQLSQMRHSDLASKMDEVTQKTQSTTQQLLQMFADRTGVDGKGPKEVTDVKDVQRVAPPEVDFRQVQMDPFAPPIRRMPINIRTRGDYDDYQVVGYAHKYNKKDLMFQLFGRRIDSVKYEYYVTHPYNGIKIPVRSRNDFELSTGDVIRIPGFRGDFHVTIYDINEPRYIPYV